MNDRPVGLFGDDILTGYGDGEYSFNRARWEYDLLTDKCDQRSGKRCDHGVISQICNRRLKW